MDLQRLPVLLFSPFMSSAPFPIDLKALKPLALKASDSKLSADQKSLLQHNIQLCRDAIIFFTATADGRGLGGHTGGAYDMMPEVSIIRAFLQGGVPIYPVYFDEAGHRVAIQYLLSAIDGDLPAEKLTDYRQYNAHLPGHPERGFTPGVKFSSGRLGHMWAYANGVAMANPDKAVFVLASDGAQMEGDDAEAARLAVAKGLNIKIIVDDNDVTIAGHPSEYMKGFSVGKTLAGHGLEVTEVQGEDIDALYAGMAKIFAAKGPQALIVKRKMAPGIVGLEGHCHGHEAIKVAQAVAHLEKRYPAAAEFLKGLKGEKSPLTFKGSSGAGKNRDDFGKIINSILDTMSPEDRVKKVHVFDNDLEGSCGLHHIHKAHPEVYTSAGIMERGNYSAAAGFGYEKGKQGIFGTFAAFLEMCVSEITMARLNKSNVLAHFSHSGVDDMADNTCHFGINNFYADGGLYEDGHDTTRLYFPADQYQFAACLKKIFFDEGLRFIFSTRSAVPDILKEDGTPFYKDKPFTAGKDDIIRDAQGGGYIVSFGETLYRALDAVINLQEAGVKVGLVNKATLNIYDEETMQKLAKAPFVLVAEGQNAKTGLGSRLGTELLKRGFKGKYNNIGTNKEGSGGLWQQMGHQGLDSAGIQKAVRALA